MRKVVITFVFCAMMSTWALNVVVPMATNSNGGAIAANSDPHTDEEW